MKQIAICDDETHALEELKRYLYEYGENSRVNLNVVPFCSAEQLLRSNLDFDLVILDIQMEGMDGMQAAGKLRGLGFKSPVLFLTALKDYVFDAFDVDAVNYLVKPVDKKKLFLSLQKALEGEQAGLLIKRGYDYRKILVSDILYFESAGRKVAVHTAGETLEYYQKIRELPARLGRSFYMPHRSFLVNLSHVKALNGNDVLMDNGDRLPIAKGKKEGLTACLLRHFRGETDA